jgi:hypothetical protein
MNNLPSLGGFLWLGVQLLINNGNSSSSICPSEDVLVKEAARHSMIANALRAFSGFCGLVLPGANYLKGTALRVLSIAA